MPYDGNQRVNQLTGILEKLNAKSDFLTDKLQAQRQLELKVAQFKNLLTVSGDELKKRCEAKTAADATVLELENFSFGHKYQFLDGGGSFAREKIDAATISSTARKIKIHR